MFCLGMGNIRNEKGKRKRCSGGWTWWKYFMHPLSGLICKYFLPFCKLPLHSVDCTRSGIVFKVCCNPICLLLLLLPVVSVSHPNNDCQYYWFFPMFSSWNYIFLSPMLRSLIHFYIWYNVMIQIHSLYL
jgi:hypothetical protein